MKNDVSNVFFLVNANRKIGTGHYIRCKIIARELKKRDVNVSFIFSDTDDKYIEETQNEYKVVRIEKDSFVDPLTYDSIITNTKKRKSLLIFDTDNTSIYDAEFQKSIFDFRIKFMFITINSSYRFYSHILLNQNIIALSQKYSTEKYTKLLLGPEYFILGDSFRTRRIKMKKYQKPYNLFVAFGGADNYNMSYKVLTELQNLSERISKINVILGPLNRNIESIKELIENERLVDIQLYVNTTEIKTIMLEADIAITSPGLTFWELATLGIPSLVIASSEREKDLSDKLDDLKFCLKLGSYDKLDKLNELGMFLHEKAISNIRIKQLQEKINLDGVKLVVDNIIDVIHNEYK